MQELNIFPTTLGVDFISLDQYINNINIWIDKNKSSSNDKSKFLKHYQEFPILDNLKFKSLKNDIENKANIYYKNFLGFREELYVSDSWLNVCEKGGYQPDHYHTNCVVSGTLYISINEKSPSIKFKNPRLLSYPTTPEIKCEEGTQTPYNSLWITVHNLKNGSILYWPSYLVHGYEESQSEDKRISLSFNLNIKTSKFKYKNPFQSLWL